ncbi:fatty acid-binding protein, liver-type-like [Neosynchiropus ocellatus]
MAFSGKYQMVCHENFEAFMKAFGMPDEFIKSAKDVMTITEIVQNGDCFKVTETTGDHVLENCFKIGQESELTTVTGEKVKAVVHCEGNKMKVSLQGVECVTELVGDNLVDTMSFKGIPYKRTSKRM